MSYKNVLKLDPNWLKVKTISHRENFTQFLCSSSTGGTWNLGSIRGSKLSCCLCTYVGGLAHCFAVSPFVTAVYILMKSHKVYLFSFKLLASMQLQSTLVLVERNCYYLFCLLSEMRLLFGQWNWRLETHSVLCKWVIYKARLSFVSLKHMERNTTRCIKFIKCEVFFICIKKIKMIIVVNFHSSKTLWLHTMRWMGVLLHIAIFYP